MPKKALPAAMLVSLLICAIGAIAFVRAAQDNVRKPGQTYGEMQRPQALPSDNGSLLQIGEEVPRCKVECSGRD